MPIEADLSVEVDMQISAFPRFIKSGVSQRELPIAEHR